MLQATRHVCPPLHRLGVGGSAFLLLISCCVVLAADDNAARDLSTGRFGDESAGDLMDRPHETSKTGGVPDPSTMPGSGPVVRMVLWVGVVIVFVYVAVFLLRKYVPSARNMFGGGVLKIVGKTYVSSKQCILLVKVGPKFVMVGVTGASMSSLAEISNPEDAKKIIDELETLSGHSITDSFRKVLSHEDDDYAQHRPEPRSRGVTDTEVGDIRRELDAVTRKMSWWRRQNKD